MSNDSEIKYRALFEQSPYGIVINDREGNILDFNEVAHRVLGYTREEFANLSIADIDAFESADQIPSRIGQVLKTGGAAFEVKHRTKQGEIRDVYVIAKPLTLSGQTVVHSIWRDITERRRIEGELRLQSEIARNISEGVYLVSASDLKIIYANPKMESMFGYDSGEMNGKHVSIINAIAGGDPVQTAIQIETALKNRGRWSGEVYNVRKDGTTFWGYASISMLQHPEYGEVYVSLQTDITERKLAEKALRRSNEALTRQLSFNEVLLNAMPIPVFFKDVNGRYLGCNKAFTEVMGVTSQEITGKTVYEMWSSDQARVYHENDLKLISNPAHQTYEFVVTDKNGATRNVIYDKDVFLNANGAVEGIVGSFVDITDRMKAEEKIRRSEEFIRSILDTVDEGFIVIDRDFSILTANKAYCRQVSLPCDEVIGKYCYRVSHRTDRPCYEQGEECSAYHVFATGNAHSVAHKHYGADGRILYIESRAYPIKDASGNVISVIESISNVTEKHLLAEERLKTQKLESIGTLAGGIAHDFNNLLQGIFGNISLAKMSLDRKETALPMLEQAEKALNMSVGLAKQLLTFSKGGNPVKKKIALKTVIKNAANFALSGARCDLRMCIDEELWPVDADEGQIGQVVQNIVLNANEAMPDGGKVEISATNVEIPTASSVALPEGGKFAKISVQDSGIGIPEQFLTRIFDPYFTTKQKGSGLGLATSYSIIRNHGGVIEVSSELNRGSTFIVFLPAITEREDNKDAPVPVPSKMLRGNILVMEDEDIVMWVVKEMLETLGHDVVCATNGKEAIDKFIQARDESRPFDVVILDLTVKGGMGGEQTLVKLKEIDPSTKAIVSTGYSDDPIVSDYLTYGFAGFLNKPFMIEALRDTLNDLLCKRV